MGTVKIKYYSVRKGRGYWISTKRMQALGLRSIIRCGVDGPEAWAIANAWNARWQSMRLGREPSPTNVWPTGSLGEGFEKFRKSQTWKDKKVRTREDWDRGWRHIAPIFGDVSPRTITFEHLDAWYHNLKAAKSVREAHRAMKIWRHYGKSLHL